MKMQGMRTNLKELPRPHKLPQGTPAKSVECGVEIGETCRPQLVLCASLKS